MFEINTLQHRGQTMVQLRGRSCEAIISLFGGQLLSWRQHGRAAILWQNTEVDLSGEQAIREGIPVCWPWFGTLAQNPAAVRAQFDSLPVTPAHGLVRQRVWEVADQRRSTSEASAALRCELTELALACTVRYTMTAKTLSIVLTSENLASSEQPAAELTCALHTYLSVSNVEQVRLDGFAGTQRVDALRGWTHSVQQGEPHVRAETDQIHLQVPTRLRVDDPALQRSILLDSFNAGSAVLWNPWQEKADRLSQFAPGAWREMLCIETARVLDDRIQLPPGSSESMGVTLSQVVLHD